MVDGEQSICFEQMHIVKMISTSFFEHNGYYEGQIISVYNKLLLETQLRWK